jgi:hypothetical protein
MGTTFEQARIERGMGAARHAQPFYLSSGEDVRTFEHCHQNQISVLLKGPTGSGKTRFVEYMAWRLARPLVCITCRGDLTANDLLGRYLVRNDYLLAGRTADAGGTQRSHLLPRRNRRSPRGHRDGVAPAERSPPLLATRQDR